MKLLMGEGEMEMIKLLWDYQTIIQKSIEKHDLVRLNQQVNDFILDYCNEVLNINNEVLSDEVNILEEINVKCLKKPNNFKATMELLIQSVGTNNGYIPSIIEKLIYSLESITNKF